MIFPKKMLARMQDLQKKGQAFWLNTKKSGYCRVLKVSEGSVLVRGDIIKDSGGRYMYDDFYVNNNGLEEKTLFGYNPREDFFYPAK